MCIRDRNLPEQMALQLTWVITFLTFFKPILRIFAGAEMAVLWGRNRWCYSLFPQSQSTSKKENMLNRRLCRCFLTILSYQLSCYLNDELSWSLVQELKIMAWFYCIFIFMYSTMQKEMLWFKETFKNKRILCFYA